MCKLMLLLPVGVFLLVLQSLSAALKTIQYTNKSVAIDWWKGTSTCLARTTYLWKVLLFKTLFRSNSVAAKCPPLHRIMAVGCDQNAGWWCEATPSPMSNTADQHKKRAWDTGCRTIVWLKLCWEFADFSGNFSSLQSLPSLLLALSLSLPLMDDDAEMWSAEDRVDSNSSSVSGAKPFICLCKLRLTQVLLG